MFWNAIPRKRWRWLERGAVVNPSRARRIAERIQRELAELLLQQVDDPRLSGVTVTAVEVDRELAFATVYVTVLDEAERRRQVLTGLGRARGFLRTQLAQRIELRTFPQLRFIYDESGLRGERIDAVLEELHRDRSQDGGHAIQG
jgi:ribosome-binding factor A